MSARLGTDGVDEPQNGYPSDWDLHNVEGIDGVDLVIGLHTEILLCCS